MSVQQTLHKDLKTYSSDLINLPLSVVEDVLNCFAETLKILDLAIVSNENTSPIKDRCFFCHSRIEELRQLLQTSLVE